MIQTSNEIKKITEEGYSWEIPEHDEHDRDRKWYTVAGAVAGAMLIFSVLTSNFLFAVIIVIAGIIYVLRHGHEVHKIKFSISHDGVMLGNKHFEFDEIKNFTIIYKPRIDVKNLYFEFKRSAKPRLSIPLSGENPLPIRKFLLQYLPEDLERVNPPISEAIARMLKL
jgi:hypothetical protein